MSEKQQNKATKKFLEIIEELKKKGLIKSDAQLAERCNYTKQSFSQIRSGKRNAPTELLHNFINKFDIDANILFKDNYQQPDVNFVQDKQIDYNHDPTDHYIETISAMRETIDTQRILIKTLRLQLSEKKGPETGQKRKAN